MLRKCNLTKEIDMKKILNMLLKLFSKIYKKKRIFISAWVDGNNYGDTYLANAVKSFINQQYGKAYKIKQISLDLSNNHISKNDVVIMAGGGLWGPSGTEKLSDDLYTNFMNTKAKLMIFNLGIESFNEKYVEQLNDIINKSSFISFRDIKSYSIAKECSPCNKVLLGMDSTYLFPLIINTNPKDNFICTNLCGPETENNIRNWDNNIIIDNLLKLKDYGFSLKSVVFSHDKHANDFDYCSKIDADCENIFSFAAYEKCELFIGMRFHSILIALQNNIPVIAINYSDKVKRIMSEYDLDCCCVNPEDLYNFDYLLDKVKYLKENKSLIINKIKEKNKFFSNKVEEFKKHLDKVNL